MQRGASAQEGDRAVPCLAAAATAGMLPLCRPSAQLHACLALCTALKALPACHGSPGEACQHPGTAQVRHCVAARACAAPHLLKAPLCGMDGSSHESPADARMLDAHMLDAHTRHTEHRLHAWQQAEGEGGLCNSPWPGQARGVAEAGCASLRETADRALPHARHCSRAPSRATMTGHSTPPSFGAIQSALHPLETSITLCYSLRLKHARNLHHRMHFKAP